jgi:hypothetical protein
MMWVVSTMSVPVAGRHSGWATNGPAGATAGVVCMFHQVYVWSIRGCTVALRIQHMLVGSARKRAVNDVVNEEPSERHRRRALEGDTSQVCGWAPIPCESCSFVRNPFKCVLTEVTW